VAPRVVSLVPSVTETLLAWGVTPVAVTRFCEQPDLPQVGGTKDPDLAAIEALAPDLVVMCVEENRRPDAAALEAAGCQVLALSIDDVDDVAPALDALASACGVAPTGGAPAGVEALPDVARPVWCRAVVPIWRRPWMVLGPTCYGTSLLARAGVEVVQPDAALECGDRYPTTTLDELVAAGVDLVLAPSEPYPFGPRHVAELEAVAPVVLVDGQDLLWWGIRTPAALARLEAQLRAVEVAR
jgi:ABC-type Fe3+-hydroxamate transport system substrate-binding protein